jgi:hypothetical protein
VRFADADGRCPGGICPTSGRDVAADIRKLGNAIVSSLGLQVEGKVGLGAAVGVEARVLGAELKMSYDGGSYNIGYNSKDGIIDEHTQGKEASVGYAGHDLVKVGSSTTTAYNVLGRTMADGRTQTNTVSKIEKSSQGVLIMGKETSKQTTYNAKAGPNTFVKGLSFHPGSELGREHAHNRTEGIVVSGHPNGPSVKGSETSVSWFGASLKAGVNLSFDFKSVFPDNAPKK